MCYTEYQGFHIHISHKRIIKNVYSFYKKYFSLFVTATSKVKKNNTCIHQLQVQLLTLKGKLQNN